MTRTDEQTELRLSLEELALILSLLGYAEAAKLSLTEYLGDPGYDELRGRMLAAGNSLLARGILGAANGQMQMEPAYADLLQPIIYHDYVVRCSLMQAGQEEMLASYYRRADQIAALRPYYGIYNTIAWMINEAAVADDCLAFFLPSDLIPFPAQPFTLPADPAQGAKILNAADADYSQSYLERIGVSPETAARFAADATQQVKRGIALRLRAGSDDEVLADRGYVLFTAASGRTWLLTVNEVDGGASVVVRPATRDLIRQETLTLLEPY